MRSCLALLVLLLACACGGPPPPSAASMPASSPSKLLGGALPSFRRPTLTGGMVDSSALRGRVVVVKFFAKYCRPCQWTLPEAQAIHRSRRDVVVVGIAEDETPDAAWEQVNRYKLTFPVVHDPARVLAGRFRVTELPITFVTDRSGRIVWVGGPEKSGRDLRQAVDAARTSATDGP